MTLLGEDGARLIIGTKRSVEVKNELDVYALEKGIKTPCNYLLSNFFDDCGMQSANRGSFAPVVVDVMERSIHAAKAASAFTTDASVALALSPYKAFGAEVMRTKHGFLVLISPVTFSICFLYAILAVTSSQATGLMQQGRVLHGPKGTPSIDPFDWAYASHRALMSMIKEFVRTGSVDNPLCKVREARFDLLPWHYVYRVQATYEHMLDFLVLHELGHICLGHMDQMEQVRRVVPCTSISYEVSSPLPAQEEAADEFAINCLVGRGHGEELLGLFQLIQEGKGQSRELDKLWTGDTSLGRYTSALQLLKFFDVLNTEQCEKNAGIQFTNLCELNGTHPSGQHRFIKNLANQHVLELPVDHQFNPRLILDWQNYLSLDAATRSQEQIRALWPQ